MSLRFHWFLRVEGARLARRPAPVPDLHFGGSG
jgi:hypothetical protein